MSISDHYTAAVNVRPFEPRDLDGVTTTYLSTIAVDRAHRGQHVGRHLIDAVFARSGVGRMDLLSTDESEEFYRRISHRRMRGYRLYRLDE